MVAPIVEQGKDSREVYFPGEAEQWFKFSLDSKNGRVKLDSITRFGGKSKGTI